MKKVIALIMALAIVLCCFAGCGKTKLRFVTGGEGGTYYQFGSQLANHASNNTKVNITAISGAGSKTNCDALKGSSAELAFCQSDVMAYAYNGERLFAEEGAITNFSTVAALYLEQVQIVTLDPEIKSVSDLKDKKVSIGANGSGVYFNAIDILGVYGLTDKDIKPTYESFNDSAESLKDGQIDAAFVVAGAPTGAIDALAAEKDVYLVSLDDEHIEKLSDVYTKDVIKAGTYKIKEDVTTVGVGAVILARDDVSEDAVYAFVKDIFDNAESLVDTHAKYGELSLEYTSSIKSVPYHAGAVKYFAEKGITVTGK